MLAAELPRVSLAERLARQAAAPASAAVRLEVAAGPAHALGVRSVPVLVVGDHVLHIDFGTSLEDLRCWWDWRRKRRAALAGETPAARPPRA